MNSSTEVTPLEEIDNLDTIKEENSDNATAAESENCEMPHEEPYEFPGGNNVVRKHRLFAKNQGTLSTIKRP
jgi:hypothetical protein